MLKHLSSDALKAQQKTHLYSKKSVYSANVLYDRKNHNSTNVNLTGLNTAQQTERKKKHAKDLNIDERISLFQNQLKKSLSTEYLKYFSDIGKINFPPKIDYRIKFFPEIDKFF